MKRVLPIMLLVIVLATLSARPLAPDRTSLSLVEAGITLDRAKATQFDVSAVQAVAAESRSAILVYSLSDPRSYLRVVTSDAVVDYVLPARRAIDAEVGRYVAALASPPEEATARDYEFLSTRLYDVLLRPAASMLSQHGSLVIVPDGSLFKLPFDSLRTTGASGSWNDSRFVAEAFTVTFVPSVPELLRLASRPHDVEASVPRALILGDPSTGNRWPALPSAETEAAEIAQLWPAATVLMKTAATKEALRTTLSRADYTILHFATHGVVNEDNGQAGLVLAGLDLAGAAPGRSSEDELLTAKDVSKLRLDRTSLVVLSACETGVASERPLSVTTAFLKAGAREVVTSLWSVNDSTAFDLMKAYYSRMRDGESPGVALKHAKIDMMTGSRLPYAHPHYWASFIHIGLLDTPLAYRSTTPRSRGGR